MSRRPVKRVLVMIDYGPDDPCSGEVFDLTALTAEMLERANYSASLSLEVRAEKTYAREPDAPQYKHMISFGGYAGEFVHGATHIDDVVNSALPDGVRVTKFKNKAKRHRKKAEDCDRDAMVAKLEQVAGIRHQHPIARVTEAPKLLEDSAG